MMDTMIPAAVREKRRYGRLPFSENMRYQCAAHDAGQARCLDAGRGGFRVHLGRYLRPGRLVMLEMADPAHPTEAVELKGRVVWCRPASESCMFEAGVRIFSESEETDATMAAVSKPAPIWWPTVEEAPRNRLGVFLAAHALAVLLLATISTLV